MRNVEWPEQAHVFFSVILSYSQASKNAVICRPVRIRHGQIERPAAVAIFHRFVVQRVLSTVTRPKHGIDL